LIGPGRSAAFALLPEGQDPDDLVRSGGYATIAPLLAQALPLFDLIWLRETEGGNFETPERRAGLERRLNEIASAIKDEPLRRHYRAEFRSHLYRFFNPRSPQKQGFRAPAGEKKYGRETPSFLQSPLYVSQSLARSPLLHAGRTALAPREGLILLLLLGHPGLIEKYSEILAETEFENGEAAGLRDALVTSFTSSIAPAELDKPSQDAACLRAALQKMGYTPVLAKLDDLAARAPHWYLKPEAAEADAEEVLKQALSLHRRRKALHKELQLAESALGNDCSEVNLGRLKDIQAQIAALPGIEAAVEGFGVPSGRGRGTL